jgi:hypothetical protein
VILIRDDLILGSNIMHHFDDIRHQVDEVVSLFDFDFAEVVNQAGRCHIIEIFRHQYEVVESSTIFV